MRRKGEGRGEEVIGQFSPTFRSRAHDNAHIFYAHERTEGGRTRAGGKEGGKD